MPERGFILTPTYRIAAGVPEVHLHSVLEGGEPAVIIDDRLAPYFFVRAADEAAVRRLAPGVRVVPSELSTLGGEPVVRVEVALPGDVPGVRTRLGEGGVDCLEADLRFAYRYLIDRGIRGAFAVAGGFERRPGVGRVYRNPTLAPAELAPRLRVLSLDVETSLDGHKLYSLAMAGAGGERVLMIARREVAGAEAVPDERALLERVLAHVRRVDPDVLTGWNVCDFDLAVLQRACRRAGLRCTLGRTDDELEIRRDPSFTRESRAVLCGRVVLDGLALLRGAFIRLEDYRLDTAAQLLIGKRKLFISEHRGAEIEAAYRDDPARLAAYNPNILVFDFKSLYPSIIRPFTIAPLTSLASPGAGPVIRTPGGAAFRRDEPGILPELVARLGLERARARAAGNAIAAQATKILMNSLFGVLGSPASRLFSPAVANAITTAGQHVIRLAAAAVADLGHRVIYGDTDSLFVDLGEPDPTRAAARGEELRAAIGGAVGDAVARDFGCTSHLELEFEKVYARFFMPEVRGGAMGSKKRYAGLVGTASGEAIELVGLEAVRRDWSGVARRFQRVLLDLVFHDRPVADFIRGFVADLRAGRFDGELAYRKAIRKPLAEYTKTTPPHVKAARKQAGATGRIVTYVVTRSGPEAVGETTAPPDYDHYVTQQLQPIAEAILRFLGGPDFEEIIDARRQLSLFS